MAGSSPLPRECARFRPDGGYTLRMKVLQIYKDFYPPVKGGIEKHVHLLSNGLQDIGVEVRALVSNTVPRMARQNFGGISVYKVPQLGRISSAPLNPTLAFWIRKLGNWADIVHFHFPNPTAEISYLLCGLKKPFVVTYHSDIIKQIYTKRLYAPFMHLFLRRAERIIVTSPQYLCSSTTLRHYRGKCTLIPLGIDFARFDCTFTQLQTAATLRERYGSPLILFVGKYRYYKGLQYLIRAMRQIDARLLIIGPSEATEPIQQAITENGVRDKVIVLGELPDNTLDRYYHACDLLVLPSIQRSEAFGIVQLEAMASGKPVVCTELGTGTTYVNVHRKTGLVVPPADSHAIARAVNTLLNNQVVSAQYGQCGKARVQQLFSLERMVEQIAALYQKATRK